MAVMRLLSDLNCISLDNGLIIHILKDHFEVTFLFEFFQAQLDRITQLGKMVTPKPHYSYYNPPLPITPKPNRPPAHRPDNPKPPAPTASYTYTLPPPNIDKTSSSFSGFISTPAPYHPTTPGVVYGGWRPFGGRGIIENT